MNNVAIAFSTKDRMDLTRRSIEPLLQPDKLDLFWMDGSTTDEGESMPYDYVERMMAKKDGTCAIRSNVRGGADAAIVYGLTTLLDHPNNYAYIGLCENDVLLHPDWFGPTMALFARGEDEGLEVGAVSARCYEDRILCQRDGYALCHNLGAGMVIFRRDAARLVLDNFRTGWTTDNRLLFSQLSGLDIGKWWAFRERAHAVTSDWIYDATLAACGLASLALTPSPCEMIGQVPPLAEQGLTLANKPVELLRNDKAFHTFAALTARIRGNEWIPGDQCSNERHFSPEGVWTIFPHQLERVGAIWEGDWRLKWTQGFGPFSWRAETPGASLEVCVAGPVDLMVSGGPKGGDVELFDPATKETVRPHLWPEGDGQVMNLTLQPVLSYRRIKLTALTAGITVYGIRTRFAQPWNLEAPRFDHSRLPPV